MACLAMNLSAQNFLGNWKSETMKEDNGMNMNIIFTFNSDKTSSITLLANISESEMDVSFQGLMHGSYETENNTDLMVTFDHDSSEVIIDKLKLKGEMSEMEGSKELEEGLKKMMQSQMNASKDELFSSFPASGTIHIVECTASTMKIKMPGDEEAVTLTKIE